ncbi:phycobiliprotein lyase [Leptothermofonsia sp. ETS-13]|uniref:phycobiliprotein lyase n=1 Tax=Leptothermofonsia sp. ETS-13 TaxID=3035696 RepID=UPI003B9E53D4
MDIVEFFQLSSGKWFSHRTSHLLSTNQSEGGKSEVQIEMLANTDSEVTRLCEQYKIAPEMVTCGIRVRWNGGLEGQGKQSGTTVLVAIADPEKPNQGKLLRQTEDANHLSPGRYIVGEDDALTLITEDGPILSEERLWFASPNLRLRAGIVKQANGFSAASFLLRNSDGSDKTRAVEGKRGKE